MDWSTDANISDNSTGWHQPAHTAKSPEHHYTWKPPTIDQSRHITFFHYIACPNNIKFIDEILSFHRKYIELYNLDIQHVIKITVLLTSLEVSSGSSFGLFAGRESAPVELTEDEVSRGVRGRPKSSQLEAVLIAATGSISTFIPSTLIASSKAELVSLLTDIRRISDDFCLALK